jgi:hypothetical protein
VTKSTLIDRWGLFDTGRNDPLAVGSFRGEALKAMA